MSFLSKLGTLLESVGFYVVEKVSPFTDVEVFENESVRVEYEGTDYECVAINDIPVADILESSKNKFGHKWKKRFMEDLTEVMAAMGKHPKGGVVKLSLLESESGQVRTIAEARLTKENRARLQELKEVPIEKVPSVAKREVSRRVKGFKLARVLTRSSRIVFRFQGDVGETPVQIKVHVRGQGSKSFVHKLEIQFELRSSHRSLKGKHMIDPARVPEFVMGQARKTAEQYNARLEKITRVQAASVQGRGAYDIKGFSGNCLVEIEVLDDGQVLEVEIEYRSARTKP